MSKQEAACSEIERFYRLCGHLEISNIHTEACISGRELRALGGYQCWNRLPKIKKPRYVVGNCLHCLERIAPGRDLITEPARNVAERGDNPVEVSYDGLYGLSPPLTYSHQRIRELALEWKAKVEEDERVSRAVELKRERELNVRKELRRVSWENDWAAYCVRTTPSVNRAKILDLTNDLSQATANDLLGICQPDPDTTCVVCTEPLLQPPGSDETEDRKPVSFLNGCMHEFHYKCIVEWLIVHDAHRNKRCPVCRTAYSIILKNDYEDPKFRWVEDRERVIADGEEPTEKNYQVVGYIEFRHGLNGNANGVQFHPFLDEDRWGDHEGHY